MRNFDFVAVKIKEIVEKEFKMLQKIRKAVSNE